MAQPDWEDRHGRHAPIVTKARIGFCPRRFHHIGGVRDGAAGRDPMRFPDTKLTLLWVGLPLSALGLAIVLASPADARKASKQPRAYFGQRAAPAMTGVLRNTPASHVVCWTRCGEPSSIVLGVDPDPFIRSQLLRDASRYFGGGDQ